MSLAVGCKAQPTPQETPEHALSHNLEVMIRAQFNVPLDYTISFGAHKPSQLSGYDTLPVTLARGGKQTVIDFLISTDNKTLAHLDTFSVVDYPLFNVANRPVRGNPAAAVTVINFDDLECPYCSQMHQTFFPATLDRYKDKVRFIYKDNPLAEIHPWAMHAAVNANCLAAQSGNAYWNYVDYLHAHGQEVNGEDRSLAKSLDALNRIARQVAAQNKLDGGQLDACLARQDESQVRTSMKEAESLGIEGAPAIFVNGARVGGAISEAQLWLMIDSALRASGVTPSAASTPQAPPQPAGTGK